MITRNLIRMVIILILIAGFPNPIRADIVTLKDGSTLEGTISAQAKDSIVVVVPGRGPLTISRSSIKSVVKQDSKTGPKVQGNVEDVQFIDRSEYLPKLREVFKSAKKSIHVAMYLTTPTNRANSPVRQLLEDLAQAHQREVDVKVVLESSDSEGLNMFNTRAAQYLSSEGIDVKIFPVYPIMHTKLVIIDDEISILGSHNWTASAFGSNNESSILIKSPAIAKKYDDYFQSLFHRAKPYDDLK